MLYAKKLFKESISICLIFSSLSFFSCNNPSTGDSMSNNSIEPNEVIIGDEIIYGESFSFENVYNAIFEEIEQSSRALNKSRGIDIEESAFYFEEEDCESMVYFSVQPSTADSLRFVNEKLGYLNPVELDKDILQACTPDKLIFTTTEIEEYENIEEYINFDTKYYYIVSKKIADELSNELEGFNLIEEFEVLTDKGLEKLENIFSENEELLETRGFFSNLWAGIKAAAKTVAKAVVTATEKVVDFMVKPYSITGIVQYTYNNITVPAYGVRLKNVVLGGLVSDTDADGKFNLGQRTDSAGLCFLWIDYENNACKLTNFLGVTASTLLKTAFPSCLQNVTITSNSDYENAKMAICCDMYSRYLDESTRHSDIPQAYVWVTDSGDGTSSSPSFHQLGERSLPDIILTGISAQSDNIAMGRLKVLHHEYTHFLHCVYAENKDNFWNQIVISEIGCTIANAAVDLINKLFETNFKTGFVSFYDFENPYVYFAENYAEWYSLVGCYSRGVIGKINDSYKGSGLINTDSKYFYNQQILIEIVRDITSVDDLSKLIDKDNITTFNELYTSLINEYPNSKQKINSLFKKHYIQKGSKDGNVIQYK